MIALVMITLSVGYLTFVAVCLYAAVISSSPICGRLNPASLRAKKIITAVGCHFPYTMYLQQPLFRLLCPTFTFNMTAASNIDQATTHIKWRIIIQHNLQHKAHLFNQYWLDVSYIQTAFDINFIKHLNACTYTCISYCICLINYKSVSLVKL